jgi:hypothetical protein
VGADGMIRTTSPPFPGVTQSGTYTIGLLPAGMPSVSSIVKTGTQANSGLINLSTNLNFENSYLGAKTSGIGAVAATENQFEATTSLLAYLAQASNKPLEMIGIPKVGETVVTNAQVQLNTQGVPTVSAVLNGPDTGLAIPLEPPSLESAALEFSNNEPVIFLTGSNFLNGLNGNLGASFGDLKVDFKVSGKNYSGTVVPGLSSSLGENRYKVAIKAPISVPLGESEIVLSRQQKERFGPGPLDSDVVKRSSFEDLQLKPVFSDLILVAQRNSDKIQVIDALSSVSTPPSPQQKPPKDLSVGIPGTAVGTTLDRPGLLAVTSNATRAYVPLEYTGRVAMVDLLARRPVDVDASTATVDDINLPSGASPGAISIDPWDNYAYIADSKRGSIYVLDVNPDSLSYNQVVQTIPVNATSGLRQIAVSSDGRKLFATGADGYIYAVNIDPEDQPTVPNSNPRKWWEQIGKVLTPTGAWGLAATPDPLKMVFTNGNRETDGSGFGVLTVSDDPLNLAPTTLYTNLTLGSDFDVFDVNEGVAVTVTADGKYAFVAGRNSKKILEVDANPLAGGNIGIIKDPLGPNPKLVAATEQMAGIVTNNVALSSDGKYLIGSYPTLGGSGNAYVFDVGEIIKTVENPAYALTTQGVEKFNPNIIPKGNIPAVIAIGGNPLGLIAAAPDPCLELIEKIVALGKELKKRYDDLRLDDQDLYHRRREISNPPVPRIPPLSGRRTTVTGDPGSWDGHIEQYDKVKRRLNELIKQFQENDDCDDRDPYGYGGETMQTDYDQALEYGQTEPPEEPDIRNRSSLLARANELGAQVIDGVLWVGAGVAGVVLIALEVIARLLGLELRSKS